MNTEQYDNTKALLPGRLAVCAWSLQAVDAASLVQKIQALDISCLQCALDPVRHEPAKWGDLGARCNDAGLTLVSGMFGTVGEDYSTLESIRQTGGVVPDATWEDNWKHIREVVVLAKQLKLKLVTFHAGFIPHEPGTAAYAKLLRRIRDITQLFADHGIALAMETGQETAGTLKAFLLDLNHANIGVNFDPANMILYAQGEPVAALRELGPWVKQCHIKDARRTLQPGTWGEEVCVGTGEVNWPGFFAALHALEFKGDLAIEREAGSQRMEDIRAARKNVEQWLNLK